MKHPDMMFVRKQVEAALKKRRWAQWTIKDVRYQFFPSHYEVLFQNGESAVSVSLVSEIFEDLEKDSSSFSLRRLRQKIKEKIPDIDE